MRFTLRRKQSTAGKRDAATRSHDTVSIAQTPRMMLAGVALPPDTTPRDVESLRQLSGHIEDGIPAEAMPRALRFLRARKHDVAQALQLWQKDVRWRADEDISDVLSEQVHADLDSALSSMYQPLVLDGRDRQGRFVMYRNLGTLDVDSYNKRKVGTLDHLVRRHVREMERLREQMEACEKVGPLGGHLSVLDLKGTSLPKFLSARPFWQAIGVLDQNHYAEMLGTLLIINPPALTQYAVNMVKPFLDPETAAKIHIRGGDPRKFLHEYVDPQYLPAHLRPAVA